MLEDEHDLGGDERADGDGAEAEKPDMVFIEDEFFQQLEQAKAAEEIDDAQAKGLRFIEEPGRSFHHERQDATGDSRGASGSHARRKRHGGEPLF